MNEKSTKNPEKSTQGKHSTSNKFSFLTLTMKFMTSNDEVSKKHPLIFR